MDQLRIAQVANFVGPASGGMRTALEALGERYVSSGAHRLLVTPGAGDSVEHTAAGTHVRLRAPRLAGGYRALMEPWRVHALLDRFGPTSVEVSDKSTLLPVAGWARRRGVGSVLLSHERLDAMLRLRTGWNVDFGPSVRALNRVLARLFDAVVVTSRFAAAEFPTVPPGRLHRMPLGVDTQLYRPGETRPVDDGTIRLVHAGRLSREKSPDLAVATAVELHARGLPVRLDVYGDGPMRRRLRRQAQGAPVVFHGHVSERATLAQRLAAADVAVSACPGETFGLSILEALACGTPVVTADRGGGRELVTSEAGDWAAPEAGALADAVLRVLSRGVEERRRGARRRAQEYDWGDAAAAMLGLHQRVAAVAGRTTGRVVASGQAT